MTLQMSIFFNEWLVDAGGKIIAFIEVAAINAEELAGLLDVDFDKFGLQKLRKVEGDAIQVVMLKLQKIN